MGKVAVYKIVVELFAEIFNLSAGVVPESRRIRNLKKIGLLIVNQVYKKYMKYVVCVILTLWQLLWSWVLKHCMVLKECEQSVHGRGPVVNPL